MKDIIITSVKEKIPGGIFGQPLPWLLDTINHLENNNKINENTKIIFDVNSKHSHNIVPRFIVPKKNTQKR